MTATPPTTPPPPATTRHSPQVPAWPERDAFLATLLRAPWSELARTTSGRALQHAVLLVDRGSLAEPASILFVGGVHGDEPASALAVARFHETCAAAPRGSRDRSAAPPAGPPLELLFVPVLNPDGFAAHAKDNARGVDLNRNFATRNFGEARRPGYHPGDGPASEPETRALVGLLARHAPLRAIVAVHQPFACVNYDGPAEALAEAVGNAASLPARADLGYPTPGSMGTYFGVERALPILTLELGPGTPDEEWPRAERALAAALAFMVVDGR